MGYSLVSSLPSIKKFFGIISQKLRKSRFQKIMICSISLDAFPFSPIFCSELLTFKFEHVNLWKKNSFSLNIALSVVNH